MRNGEEEEEDDDLDRSLEYNKDMVDVDRLCESVKLAHEELE